MKHYHFPARNHLGPSVSTALFYTEIHKHNCKKLAPLKKVHFQFLSGSARFSCSTSPADDPINELNKRKAKKSHNYHGIDQQTPPAAQSSGQRRRRRRSSRYDSPRFVR